MPFVDHDNVIEAGRETPTVRRLTDSYGWYNLKSDGGRDGRQLGAARRKCRLRSLSSARSRSMIIEGQAILSAASRGETGVMGGRCFVLW